jgi:hypothetical protein
MRQLRPVQGLPEQPVRADRRRQCLRIGQKLQRRHLRHPAGLQQCCLLCVERLLQWGLPTGAGSDFQFLPGKHERPTVQHQSGLQHHQSLCRLCL